MTAGFYLVEGGTTPSRCPNARTCLGGTAAGPPSCAHGTGGVLCGRCQRGFHRGTRGCEACTASGSTLAGFLMLAAALSLSVGGLYAYFRSQMPRASGGDGAQGDAAAQGESSAAKLTRFGWPYFTARWAAFAARWLPASAPRQAMTVAKVLISYMQVSEPRGLARRVPDPGLPLHLR